MTVLEVIRKHLPEGYAEAYNWGMVSFGVPLATYPKTYNKQPLMYMALGNKKGHIGLYLCQVYGNEQLQNWFVTEWEKTGKKRNMGKSCVRFKTADDLPLALIAQTVASTSVADFIAQYEECRGIV